MGSKGISPLVQLEKHSRAKKQSDVSITMKKLYAVYRSEPYVVFKENGFS